MTSTDRLDSYVFKRNAPETRGIICRLSGPLAQLVEHLTFNQVVAGSIPARPTIYDFKTGI